MKQSTFSKALTATGKNGTFTAQVVATMNTSSKIINGTNNITHDDYTKQVWQHKVEVFIKGQRWKYSEGLTTEREVLHESNSLMKDAQLYLNNLATQAPVISFTDKMNELFK